MVKLKLGHLLQKFLLRIIEEIKKVVPESFIVGVRISPEIEELGIHLDESLELGKLLAKTEIDFIHLSCWDCFKSSIWGLRL